MLQSLIPSGSGSAAASLALTGGILSGLLSFSGTGHAGIQLNNLTTTQQNALTGAAGNLIYNTTTAGLSWYQGSGWVGLVGVNGKSFTFNNTIALSAGADGQTFSLPAASDTLAGLGTAQSWTAAQTFSGAPLIISGNINAAAWTTSGVRIKGTSGTLTDTSSSGTVATAYTDVLGGNTIAASSATTFTNYFSMYVNAPTAGTNVTFTNKWAIGGDSLKIGTSNQLTVTAAGVLTAISPVFTTPALGVATGTSLTASGLLQAGTTLGINTDVLLNRINANILGLQNGTSAQRFEVYEDSESSNAIYSRAFFDAGKTSAGVLQMGSEHAGTTTSGTNLTKMQVFVDGTSKLDYNVSRANEWAFAVKTTVTGNFSITGTFQFGNTLSSPYVQLDPQASGTFDILGTTPQVNFGGHSASFPALKRSSAVLQARLADDSNFAALQGALKTAVNATTGLAAGVLAATTNASIVVTDASGQDYRIPCII